MSYYAADITLGDLSWTIVYNEDGTAVSDDLLVLDSLSFGWRMPDGLWPQQPEPMTASLALNVPDFSDGPNELKEGDPCSISVKLAPLADPFVFYGLISDLKAVPRGRTRPGVTLSVVAVDPTTTLYELPEWTSGTAPPPVETYVPDLLEQLWDDRNLGDFPGWPTTDFGAHAIYPGDQVQTPGAVIEHELLQSISTDVTRRLILAPVIDSGTGLADADTPWSFDVVTKAAAGTALEIPAALVDRSSIEWLFARNTGPTRVEATGDGGVADNRQVAAYDVDDPHPVTERIPVTFVDGADAQDVADFYLPPESVSRWRLQRFRFLIGRAEGGLLNNNDLFPDWTGTDTTTRAACYGRPITLTDVPTHQTPVYEVDIFDPAPPTADVAGRLAGADLTISGGRVVLDLQLRQTE